MRRGFQTEAHVVVYCDTCGDIYTDREGESICFATTNQAAEFLNADTATGWLYDGDTIRCDGCVAAASCLEHGHRFIELGWPTVWPVPAPAPRECSVCGLPKSDLPELEK